MRNLRDYSTLCPLQCTSAASVEQEEVQTSQLTREKIAQRARISSVCFGTLGKEPAAKFKLRVQLLCSYCWNVKHPFSVCVCVYLVLGPFWFKHLPCQNQ